MDSKFPKKGFVKLQNAQMNTFFSKLSSSKPPCGLVTPPAYGTNYSEI